MADELKKVQDGQPLAIPAAAYNAFIDAVRRLKVLEHEVRAGRRDTRGPQPAVILVKNDSGASVGWYGVLGVDAPIITPAANLDVFKQRVALTGSTPAAGHRGKFVVLLEPLAAGAIGRAVVAGVVICRCVFPIGNESRVDTQTGSTLHLEAIDNGSGQVLWKEAGTGEKWAVIRMQGAPSSTEIVRFRTTEPLVLGGEATAVILTWNGTSYDEGATIVVTDSFLPGRWSAVTGGEGIAVKLPDQDGYDILWVEHTSIFATATLTGNMTAGTAAATFTDFWQGPNGTAGATNVYDVDGRYAALVTGDKVLCCWDDVESKYKICDGPQATPKEKWAYARTDWVNAAANGSFVPCDSATGKDGASTGIDIGNVYLPRGGDYDPDVRQGEIIAYTETVDGFKIAKGYVSDRIGVIKIWSGSVATIARGWAFCNGANGTPDLREKFVLGAVGDSGGDTDFDGEGGNTFVGSVGGLKEKLVNWEHTRFGDPDLVTNSTELSISQIGSFHTEREDPPLSVTATGTFDLDGQTEFATAQGVVATEASHFSVDADPYVHSHREHVHPLAKTNIRYTDASPGGTEVSIPAQLFPCVDVTGSCDSDDFRTGIVSRRDDDPDLPCCNFVLDHEFIEPGITGAHTDASLLPLPDPRLAVPTDNTTPGHYHVIDTLTVDASGLTFALHWDETPPDPYAGHYHWVFAGTLDGLLVIFDVTHGGIPYFHYHTLFLDNHQETINRIPPYYALAYIMRVN